jgi:hypothetical protein
VRGGSPDTPAGSSDDVRKIFQWVPIVLSTSTPPLADLLAFALPAARRAAVGDSWNQPAVWQLLT